MVRDPRIPDGYRQRKARHSGSPKKPFCHRAARRAGTQQHNRTLKFYLICSDRCEVSSVLTPQPRLPRYTRHWLTEPIFRVIHLSSVGAIAVGQEITSARFHHRDFKAFEARLREETALLADWFRQDRFADEGPVGGFELEAWLVDGSWRPAPLNEQFLERLSNPLVVPELAKFNVELNTPPHRLTGRVLSRMHQELAATLTACDRVGEDLDLQLVTIGILPTVRQSDFCLSNMSSLQRYRALNEQVLRLRGGRPLELDIEGPEHLRAVHEDVMLESAATSLQIHLQVGQAEAARFYNASKVAAAPMVAACANAPYLYGKDLWDETRIPLFEQAVDVSGGLGSGSLSRVTFGKRYVRESLMECFQANLDYFDILLPMVFDEPPQELAHVRLHNGTIWRWNRPLIGFSGSQRTPHLRIEHRVVSAPNSAADTIANAAFFFGLVRYLATRDPAPELVLDFQHARDNFYRAARQGLRASVVWLDGVTVPLYALLRDELLPRAREGLAALGIAGEDIEHYLGIMESRLTKRQNGSAWQRAFVRRHGDDMQALTEAYVGHQRGGEPVHDWTF